MSTAYETDGSGSRNISLKVGDDFVKNFDRAIKRGQLNGELPMDMSRSEAIRRLMKLAIEDPSLLANEQREDSEEM
ncbi:hypothetical protein C440_07477 [Haloferax mucosum ATCC BAA-1512]|uniref:Uncharacterized protein n=1 Tax=Haloferax mucosum ATCC BAA-1512 TaxID=662479 RepID=M0IGC4_9EURY|nr:hypothetical protein [Haloferax mucosum]ELZ94898.1 hypothetical protein C440_07477 [Haloferax mucosum ATCC BAA-1512]